MKNNKALLFCTLTIGFTLLHNSYAKESSDAKIAITSDGITATVHSEGKLIGSVTLPKRVTLYIPEEKGSYENPAVVNSSKIENLEDLNNYIDKFIFKKYPGSQQSGYTLNMNDNKTIYVAFIEFDNKRGIAYFDVTKCFNELKDKDPEIKDMIKIHQNNKQITL